MACVLSRCFKEFDHGTYSGTKLYPVVLVHDFGQYAQSAVSFTYAMYTINWTIHFPGTLSTYNGYIHCTTVGYWPSSGNYEHLAITPNYYGGIVSGIGPKIGSGYTGLDISTWAATNQQYAMYAEGKVSFFT